MYRALYTRILPLHLKIPTRLSSSIPYFYEMPECYQKAFFLANASHHENINWYYYHGIELSFNNLIRKFKNLSPSSKEEDIVNNVVNKISLLEYCTYILEVNIPVMKDSGKAEMVKAYCAKHGMHYPKHLGGLRISDTIEKSQMMALATLGSFKNICAGIPFGGSYAGIKIDPSEYSENELKRLVSTFTTVFTKKNFIGPQINFFEPDQNCSENLIDIITEKFIEIKGVCDNDNEKDFACIAGKPLANGGLQNYDESKADGIFYGADKFINHDLISYFLKMEPGWKNKTYIIKSLDRIGIKLVEHLTKHGAICIGVSEPDCSYYDISGIHIEEAINYKIIHGSCKNYFPVYNEKKIMKEKCDILIITDTSHRIDYHSAPHIEANIIIEAAWGAITPSAHKILMSKEKFVIPDVYINAGASVASYVEYVKNINPKYLEKDTCNNLLFSQARAYLSPQYGESSVIQYKPEFEKDNNSEHDFLKPAIEYRMSASAMKIMKILREYNLNLDIRTATYIMTSEKIFDLLQNNRFF